MEGRNPNPFHRWRERRSKSTEKEARRARMGGGHGEYGTERIQGEHVEKVKIIDRAGVKKHGNTLF